MYELIETAPPWSTEDDETLVRLWAEGLPVDRIAGELGRTVAATYTRITQLRIDGVDIPYRRRRWTAAEVDAVANYWLEGLSAEEIAPKVGRSTSAINALLKRLRRAGDTRCATRWERRP